MMKLFFSLVCIIIFYQNINQAHALRCAHSCSIPFIALGSPDPIKTPCNPVDIDTTTTICSVFLTINFETSLIHGTLTDKPRSVPHSAFLHSSFQLMPHKTLAFINYECSTTDDCDQEFVRETISSSKWSQLNETKLQADITSLVFKTDSSTDNLTCANNLICLSTEHCYAQLSYNSSASQTDFNNNFPCDHTSPSQIILEQNFIAPSDNQDWTMTVFCNKNDCNQNHTIDQVYNIFRNDFTLPLNYSEFTPEPKPTTTPTPKPNGVHRINNCISIPVLVFICIYMHEVFFE